MQIIRPPQQPPSPIPEPSQSTLGGKVWHTLREALAEGFRIATYPIAMAIQWGVEFLLELFRKEAIEMTGGMLTDIRDQPDTPQEIKQVLNYILTHEGELSGFLLSNVGGGMASGVMGGMMPAMTANITAWAWRKTQGMRLDPASAITAAYRGWIGADMLTTELRENGYNDWRSNVLKELSRPMFDPQTWIALWHRGITNEAGLNSALDHLGFNPTYRDMLKTLSHPIPGSGDLISMAVREAWDDSFASRWGTDSLFPAPFGEWMEKQGWEPEWAKRYWRAHWVLPSLTMGFEMFQRGFMTLAELKGLLKAQDIMPGYQDKLIDIAYLPYTRVDARRMYGMGILDRAAVKRAYLDLGYNEERAENMTQFTVLYETEGNRELAKTDILDGYKRSMIPYDKANTMLQEMGYPEEDSAFLLSRVDLQVSQAIKDDTLTAIKANYVDGTWELPQTVAAMGKLNLPAKEEDRILALWDIERERRIQRPGIGYLVDFFTRSVITEAHLRSELDHQGFSDTYIEWYVDSIEAQKRETLEKLAEAEQKRLLAQTKSPSKVELAVWWTRGFITEADMKLRMLKLGYAQGDIDNFVKAVEAEIAEERARESETELRKRLAAIAHPSRPDLKVFYTKGLITEADFRAELAVQGFEQKWIDRYILSVQPEAEEEEL